MLPLSLLARKLYRNGDGFQLEIYSISDDSLPHGVIEQDNVGKKNSKLTDENEDIETNENTISNLIV